MEVLIRNSIIFRYEIITPKQKDGTFFYKNPFSPDFVRRNWAEAQRESLTRQSVFPGLQPALLELIAGDYRRNNIPPITRVELIGSARPGIDAAITQSDMDILIVVAGEVSRPLFSHMRQLMTDVASQLRIPYTIDTYTRSLDFYNRLMIEIKRT